MAKGKAMRTYERRSRVRFRRGLRDLLGGGLSSSLQKKITFWLRQGNHTGLPCNSFSSLSDHPVAHKNEKHLCAPCLMPCNIILVSMKISGRISWASLVRLA